MRRLITIKIYLLSAIFIMLGAIEEINALCLLGVVVFVGNLAYTHLKTN